jgi:hypothetical protein
MSRRSRVMMKKLLRSWKREKEDDIIKARKGLITKHKQNVKVKESGWEQDDVIATSLTTESEDNAASSLRSRMCESESARGKHAKRSILLGCLVT